MITNFPDRSVIKKEIGKNNVKEMKVMMKKKKRIRFDSTYFGLLSNMRRRPYNNAFET
jgi:hypothetical protein